MIGDSDGNPVMNYLTGGVHLEGATVVKRAGKPLTLLHGSMERDSVAGSGLRLVDRDRDLQSLSVAYRNTTGDQLAAAVEYYSDVMADQGLSGRIGVYGRADAGAAYALLRRLQEANPDVELVGEYGDFAVHARHVRPRTRGAGVPARSRATDVRGGRRGAGVHSGLRSPRRGRGPLRMANR